MTENENLNEETVENTEPISEAPALDESYDVEAANSPNEAAEDTDEDASDVSELLLEDITLLRESFPELSSLTDISQLQNPTRYAALRDLGLTAEEAYLATSKRETKDNRAHLRAAVPAASRPPYSSMTRKEWQAARELFEDMSDSEIEKLYRKVTR